jgi:acyl carrier protein
MKAPDESDLREELERLVRAHSKLELGAIGDDAVLGHELGFDSHALLALLLEVEDAFGVEIPEERTPELPGISFDGFARILEDAVRTHGKAHGERA